MIQKTLTKHTPIVLKKPNLSSVDQNQEELDWKIALRKMITDVDDLFNRLEIQDNNLRKAAKNAQQQFPLRVTESYLNKIAKNTLDDPLLRQILPISNELNDNPNYSSDPTGDANATQSTGLLHKYHGRVLLILTEACAIHCRYCFRREHPYSENTASEREWQNILNYIQADTNISEVILSGGDPLMLSNEKLNRLCTELAAISHLKRLRIHTRLPIVLPERITNALCQLLSDLPFEIILVVHCNHANELDRTIAKKIDLLKAKKITVLNQAVLLAGVNDDVKTQVTLSEALFEHGILPYYLHVLDKAHGTSHFDTSRQLQTELYTSMQRLLPGYLLPKLVQDLPDSLNKTLLFSNNG